MGKDRVSHRTDDSRTDAPAARSVTARRIGAVPPAPAERGKERRGVGIPARLSLNERKLGLLKALFRVEDDRRGYLTETLLRACDLERVFGATIGQHRRVQRVGVAGERSKRVGDVLEAA